MTAQKGGSLFDMPEAAADPLGPGFEKHFNSPLAHRGDEISSYRAGDRAVRSGRVRGQMRAILQTVRQHQGLTSAELARVMGTDRHEPARRLAALERRGLVKRGRLRTCETCKSLCLTWWAR